MHRIIFLFNYLTTKAVANDMLCGLFTTSLCLINFLTLTSFGEGAGLTRIYKTCITICTSKITVYTWAN